MHIPDPVENMKIHVRQTPGYSYPQPASRVRIHEQNINPGMSYGQPWARHTSQQVVAVFCFWCSLLPSRSVIPNAAIKRHGDTVNKSC